ncbi:MAG: protein kinase [Candidatus Sulfotelmatobacter sp.]|jgi:Tol biopolymer transport system component/predicted Ser/Thr protein kinase
MALTTGTKLGPYEIESPLGAGGMGEVYRARDARLGRTVAIKILPAHLSSNAEAKQRLEREARAISSLNHPNICTLYDVGHQDGADFLVMEYLEGETLADRLAKGPLPPEQVLKYGIEICEGLERAHRGGVTHRDLKPGNIMLTKTGAKLMDFGLAKAATAGVPPSSSLTATLSGPSADQPLTAHGMVVGTFQYMSPEQVEGKEADARSDIFALGAVLYEMATGKRAFTGKTQASIVAAILASEPQPISVVQPMSPPALDRVVKVCLAKDPDERFQTVHDLKLQLKWIVEGGSQAGVPAPLAARRKSREQWAWALAGLALLGAVALGFLYWRVPRPEARPVRSSILPPEKATFAFLGPNGSAVLSPDGRNVAFSARLEGIQRLWVRPLNDFVARPLAGTEDAYGVFWSADSRNLGYFSQGRLKRVAAAGGPPLTICDVEQARGGSWSSQDVIIFAKYPGEIYRVPASGGAPQKLTSFDPARHDTTHRWPYFLPDGNHFLYMASVFGSVNEDNVFVLGSLDGKVNRILFHGSSNIAYGDGHLVYAVDKTLLARPFDAGKLEFTGDAVPVAESVQFDPIFSDAVFSVSENGALLYQTGTSFSARTVALFSPDGKALQSVTTGGTYFPRFSPDGKRLAYTLIDTTNGKADVWIQDIATGSRIRLTVDPVRSYRPIWSRDGSQVAYYSTRSGKPTVYIKAANGMGVEQRLWEGSAAIAVCDWTPDSKALVLEDRSAATGRTGLKLLPLDGKEPTPLLDAPNASIYSAEISADGRWIAYQSDESGKYEIYVSPFPKPVGRLQISLAGGKEPRWRHDGKVLYYVTPDGKLTAAELKELNGSLQVVSLRTLFQTKISWFNDTYDVSPDASRFVVDSLSTDETPAPISLVLNWASELRK